MDDVMRMPICARGQARCLAARLNVRTQPATSETIAGSLVQNQTVTIWAVDGDWAIVQAENGLTGWCAMRFLQVIGVLVA